MKQQKPRTPQIVDLTSINVQTVIPDIINQMILIGLRLKHNFQAQVNVIAQIGSGDERKTIDQRIPINMRKSGFRPNQSIACHCRYSAISDVAWAMNEKSKKAEQKEGYKNFAKMPWKGSISSPR